MQNLHQMRKHLDIWRHTLYKSVLLRRGKVFPRFTLKSIGGKQDYNYWLSTTIQIQLRLYIYIYITHLIYCKHLINL